MSKRGLDITLEQAKAHADKHGYKLSYPGCAIVNDPAATKVFKPRMNKTETEYARILEARKRKGEILDFKFEGISLAWGAHPDNGKSMYYTADFAVTRLGQFGVPEFTLIEVKGPHIWDKDWIRFKGCRAEWGKVFKFELHQKAKGEWKQLA